MGHRLQSSCPEATAIHILDTPGGLFCLPTGLRPSGRPAGRCKVVHLHPPWILLFSFLQTTIHAQYCKESDTETRQTLFYRVKYDMRCMLVFHKYRHRTDLPSTVDYSLWVCTPLEKILRAPMLKTEEDFLFSKS